MEWMTRELRAMVLQRPGPQELGQLLSRLVASRVAHDALRLIGSNPALGLETGAFSFWHGYEPDLGRALLLSHYRGEDPLSPQRLALRRLPGGVMGDRRVARTRHVGEPGEGSRWERLPHDVFAANGAGSELRLVLRDSRGSWGMLGLLRAEGGIQFSQKDVEKVAEMTPTLVAAVRALVTSHPLRAPTPAPPAGVIILDQQHQIKAVTPQAREWLHMMGASGRYGPPEWTIEPFHTGMSLAVRRRARDANAPVPLACAPPICFGRWVTVQGQPLDEGGTGDVAIVIQAAGKEALLPFCEWHGITERERAVVQEVCTGSAPKQIARRLDLSLHTVNAHLKAVYRKTGANGRDELIAAITA